MSALPAGEHAEEIVPGSWAYGYDFDARGRPLRCSRASAVQTRDLGGGYCHALALVLHERHGWPLRALGRPADEFSFTPWSGLSRIPDHVYCLRDDGLPVDVYGLFADEAAICRFYAHQHNPDEQKISVALSAEQLRDLADLGFSPLYEQALDYARQAADELALHELEAPRPALQPTEAQPALGEPGGPAQAGPALER